MALAGLIDLTRIRDVALVDALRLLQTGLQSVSAAIDRHLHPAWEDAPLPAAAFAAASGTLTVSAADQVTSAYHVLHDVLEWWFTVDMVSLSTGTPYVTIAIPGNVTPRYTTQHPILVYDAAAVAVLGFATAAAGATVITIARADGTALSASTNASYIRASSGCRYAPGRPKSPTALESESPSTCPPVSSPPRRCPPTPPLTPGRCGAR